MVGVEDQDLRVLRCADRLELLGGSSVDADRVLHPLQALRAVPEVAEESNHDEYESARQDTGAPRSEEDRRELDQNPGRCVRHPSMIPDGSRPCRPAK
jgi:hypothetical protein